MGKLGSFWTTVLSIFLLSVPLCGRLVTCSGASASSRGVHKKIVNSTLHKLPMRKIVKLEEDEHNQLGCVTDTGASCRIFGCQWNGPSTCVQGRCVCQTGYCADASGMCRGCSAIHVRVQGVPQQANKEGQYTWVEGFLINHRSVWKQKDGDNWMWYCQNHSCWILTSVPPNMNDCEAGIVSPRSSDAATPLELTEGWKAWDGFHWVDDVSTSSSNKNLEFEEKRERAGSVRKSITFRCGVAGTESGTHSLKGNPVAERSFNGESADRPIREHGHHKASTHRATTDELRPLPRSVYSERSKSRRTDGLPLISGTGANATLDNYECQGVQSWFREHTFVLHIVASVVLLLVHYAATASPVTIQSLKAASLLFNPPPTLLPFFVNLFVAPADVIRHFSSIATRLTPLHATGFGTRACRVHARTPASRVSLTI